MEVVSRDVFGDSETECATILSAHFLEIEVCTRNVRSRFPLHSRIAQSEVLPGCVFHQARQEIGG